MKNYVKIFASIVFCVFINYGCEKENITINVPTGPVSFSNNIVPIFQAQCIECHNTGGQAPNLANNPYQSLISGGYINTSNPSSSEIYVILSTSNMGNTTIAQQQEILTWITQGGLNN